MTIAGKPAQEGLFDSEPEILPAARPSQDDRLMRELPAALRLGTSSWHFPGWQGLVWRDPIDSRTLSRHGLAAYAAHGLYRTVSVDRTFYSPPTRSLLGQYERAVDDEFRFVLKTWRELSEPRRDGSRNPDFLSPTVAADRILGPAVEMLGRKLGALHLQFSPAGSRLLARHLDRFLTRLDAFFDALPEGPLWVIEPRHTDLYAEPLFALLRRRHAVPCLTVHPALCHVETLAARMGADWPALMVRWNLGYGRQYEASKRRYAPFDRLVDPDPETRAAVAEVIAAYLQNGKPVTVIANNKAEGSAPLTLRALAADVLDRLSPSGAGSANVDVTNNGTA